MQNSIGTRIYKSLPGDRVLWLVWALLAVFSIMVVYSSTGTLAYQNHGGYAQFFLMKRIIFLIIGGGLAFGCGMIPYNQYNKWAPALVLLAGPLLLLTLWMGVETNDAKRWLAIPFIGMTFQTSDFAKLALIIYLARVISVKQDIISDFNNAFLPIIVPIALICVFIAPADLSTSLMLFATCAMMMFIGRVKLKFIFLTVLIGGILIAILMLWGSDFDVIRSHTWISRVQDFFNPSVEGFQVSQGKIAIAEGAWHGLGPGNSIQRNFLPSPYSDFIFAIICEEYGLIGAFIIILLYCVILYRSVKLLTRFPKAFGGLVATGLALNIVLQAFLNIAVSVDLVPVTGLTLPMVSMGGTSLLFTCIAFGIIFSVSKHQEELQKQAVEETSKTPYESNH